MQKTLEQTLSEEEKQEIITMYKNNVSLREIQRKTGHGRWAVSKMLTNLGVKTTKGNHYRTYFFDFDYFEKIDSPTKAYWLGFMYADGCINEKLEGVGEQSFKLALGIQDIDVLYHFKKDLKSTYPIRYDESKHNHNPNAQIQGICDYRSQKTVDDLKRLGCVERKSLILKFPTEDQVPREYIYDFIRGYFDGDGSISCYGNAYQISFVGTGDFITTLSTYFSGGSVIPDKRKKNSWYFSLGGNQQVIAAYHKMYDGAERYMNRKYQKFQELLNKYNES